MIKKLTGYYHTIILVIKLMQIPIISSEENLLNKYD